MQRERTAAGIPVGLLPEDPETQSLPEPYRSLVMAKRPVHMEGRDAAAEEAG